MIYMHLLLLVATVVLAARLGGIGVGLAGGVGMSIAVFGFGLEPGKMPISVLLIILSVILALAVMQRAGGLDYMVKVAERLLRNNPKYINVLAPLTTFVLTVLSGTQYTTLSILNVIQQVAKSTNVRPSQPLTASVVACQVAITASPISAATAAMWVVVEQMGVSFGSVLAVIIPTGFVAACVATFVAVRQGCDLLDDPIYKARLESGQLEQVQLSEDKTPDAPEAKRSVLIFLASVVFIVIMLMFKKVIGHGLGSRDLIVITMFVSALITAFACKVDLKTIKKASVLADGAESLIVILGIAWLSGTVIGAHIPEIKAQAGIWLEAYPMLLALIFWITSAALFSHGATSALLIPIAGSMGISPEFIVGSFVAMSAMYITNIYPTSAFAISTDDTGSYESKRWNGSRFFNHPFILPGISGILVAVPFGFMLASIFIAS
ncbi:anaerobic C4-dicarboxylate transporter family protein [Vibrio hangzhouensis]|uniref:C4-dicarboxylate transporter n=1 Tax=Vibrio hangzhouensis TaxID=462991 RepID=A0A1H5V1E4_9VIBR|nr:anaerobic C4-dicarboxylate transporter family protein [Vibrio hangzhouensis]SEF81195.1 anaerobic C4-dicarboxylate transporter DcuA [Vibrio hangzhouensis]